MRRRQVDISDLTDAGWIRSNAVRIRRTRDGRYEIDIKKRERDSANNPSGFPFGKKKIPLPKSKRRSSLTIGQALSSAQSAGNRIGDTGAFDTWLQKTGLDHRGPQMQKKLKAAFFEGVG